MGVDPGNKGEHMWRYTHASTLGGKPSWRGRGRWGGVQGVGWDAG